MMTNPTTIDDRFCIEGLKLEVIPFFDDVDTEAEQLGEHLREGCRALPEPKPLDIFDYVYAEQTPELVDQQAGFAAYLDSFETAGSDGGAR